MTSLKVDDIYTDKMVVPANKAFTIAGQAVAKARVDIELIDRLVSTQADATGAWVAEIAPLPEKITTTITIKSLEETLTLKEVRTGTVLLLTGQSNIEFKFRDDSEYQDQIDHLDLQNVYFYNVPQLEYRNQEHVLPNDLKKSNWQIADEKTLWEMSDIGYWMAKRLHELDSTMIVGIIDCYKGGTSASSWVPKEVLQSDPELINRYIKPFKKATTGKTKVDYDREFKSYNALVEKHNTDLAKFMKENPKVSLSDAKGTVGHTPWPPPMTPTSYLRPSGLYHTMIEQVQHFTFDKVIWYQGENDADNPDVYGKLLRGLILSWRKLFNDRALPFYIVQLPGYFDEPKDAWPTIRQNQLQVSQTVNDVHLISIADTGETHNIHPTHKRIAGTRIGTIVSGVSYDGTPVVYRYEIVGKKLILFVAKVSALIGRGKIEFMLERDGKWVSQEVQIVGSTIVINQIQNVKKIRYEFKNDPNCTIFNEIGAPLAPFEMEIG